MNRGKLKIDRIRSKELVGIEAEIVAVILVARSKRGEWVFLMKR